MQLSKEKRLAILVAIILIFGLMMVYSSSWPYAVSLGQKPEYFFQKQLVSGALGIVVMLLASIFPYKIYERLALPFYLLAYGLCLLLFTPLGDSYGTFARRWLNLGPLSFMPSDILKIAAIIVLAKYLSQRKENLGFKQDFLPVIAFIGLTILPVYKQPNLSTVILLIGVLFSMYYLSGMKIRYILSMVPIGLISILVFFSGDSNAYRRERIKAMINPLEDYLGSGWQLSQALFAVSSGGIFGLGIGQSRQKHLYLSEAHNDFIFAIIAEELGLLGGIFVVVSFLLFMKLGFSIANSAKDDFGKLLASGLTLIICLQAFINLGVAVGFMPPTGLVLPFISYGGTSLVINLAMVGVLINIARTNRRNK